MTKILKPLFLFFSIATIIIYFAACEKYAYIIEPPDTETPISYSKEIQFIFDASCVRCHGGSIAPDLRAGNSYKALYEGGYLILPPENSKLYKAVVDNLHSSFTNQDEKNKIYAWLYQGAEEKIEAEDN